MLTYCLRCKKNTKNVDSKVIQTKNDKTTLSSKCVYVVVENLDL